MKAISKICVIGDCHIGQSKKKHLNNKIISKLSIQSLEAALASCIEIYNPGSIMILGDLFDSVVVDASFVREVNSLFKEVSNKGIQIYVMVGNHDVNDSSCSLWYLNELHCDVIDEVACVDVRGSLHAYSYNNVLCIPFVLGSNCRDEIATLSSKHTDCNVMFGHFGLFRESSKLSTILNSDPWFISIRELNVLLDKTGSSINCVVCGHNHDFFDVTYGNRRFISFGSLSPTAKLQHGFNFGRIGCLGLDSSTIEVHYIEEQAHGVRYITRADIDEHILSSYCGHIIFIEEFEDKIILDCIKSYEFYLKKTPTLDVKHIIKEVPQHINYESFIKKFVDNNIDALNISLSDSLCLVEEAKSLIDKT